MQGSAGSACCLAFLITLGVKAHDELTDVDLKHGVSKRSTNETEYNKSDMIPDVRQQDSATEDSSFVNENEKGYEEIHGQDRSGADESSLVSLDSALTVAQAETKLHTAAAPSDEHLSKADSNLYSLENSSSGNDSAKAEASTPVAGVENSSSVSHSGPQRRASPLYRTGYNAINNKPWGNLLNSPNNLQLNAYATSQAIAEPSKMYGDPESILHNSKTTPQFINNQPNSLTPNYYSKENYPTIVTDTNPYYRTMFVQGLYENPLWKVRPSSPLAPLNSAAPNVDPLLLLQQRQNSYQPIFLTSADAITSHQTRYSRKLITRNERVYLQNVPETENLVTCTREGEFYSLHTPWKECLVCVCLRERGRVQPVCVNCAGCASGALAASTAQASDQLADASLPQPFFESETPVIVSQAGQEIKVPGLKESCVPFPFGVPFEHPLNPCQICLCQKKRSHNEVFVSCVRDSRCVKPLDIPVLPPTPIPQSPIPTPLCDKFPKNVEFPHPTDACKKCKCLEYVSTFGIPEQHISCIPDTNCGEAASQSHRPVMYTEPYIDQEQLKGLPTGPITPMKPYQADPLLQLDTFLFPPDTNMQLTADSLSSGVINTATAEASVVSPDNTLWPQLLNEPALLPLSHERPVSLFPTEQELLYGVPSFDVSSRPQQPDAQLSLTAPDVPLVQYAPELISSQQAFSDSIAGNEPLLYSSSPGRPEVYSIRPDLVLPGQLTDVVALPGLLKETLPWPPLTVPAFPKQKYGPLLGPPPHKSCQPYPTNTPFQHPWDECQICACDEFVSPGQVSIEVNCYTKASCCALPVSTPSLTSGQLTSQSQMLQINPSHLQLQDKMCELKTFGVDFVSPLDACEVCTCRPAGRLVRAACRRVAAPHCKTKTAPAPTELEITYIETKCRRKPPNQPFAVGCSVCVCQTVFTFVIARCTLQPKCIQRLESGNNIVDVQQQAVASALSEGGYSPTFMSAAPGYQSGTLSPSAPGGLYTASINELSQLQGEDHYQYGQYPLNQVHGYRPAPSPMSSHEAASLLALHNQNAPVNIIKASASGSSGVRDISQASAHLYQSLSSHPQSAVASAQTNTEAQSITSLEAFIEAINGPYQKKPQPSYFEQPNGYSQSQIDSDLKIEASSIMYPLNNGYDNQQSSSPYQNFLQTEYLSAKSGAGSKSPENIFANTNSISKPWNLKQTEADTSPFNEVLSSTYLPNGNHPSSSRVPLTQKSTLYPPGQSLWDSTTLAYDQSDTSARAMLQALAGSGGAVVTRTGRGQCQYAGDIYHRNCQACYCFADEAAAGDIYSMCLGNPCN